jgi:hypothetical protein
MMPQSWVPGGSGCCVVSRRAAHGYLPHLGGQGVRYATIWTKVLPIFSRCQRRRSLSVSFLSKEASTRCVGLVDASERKTRLRI